MYYNQNPTKQSSLLVVMCSVLLSCGQDPSFENKLSGSTPKSDDGIAIEEATKNSGTTESNDQTLDSGKKDSDGKGSGNNNPGNGSNPPAGNNNSGNPPDGDTYTPIDKEDLDDINRKCTAQKTGILKWESVKSEGNYNIFNASYRLSELDKNFPGWTSLQIAADGAVNRTASLTVGPTSFTNTAQAGDPNAINPNTDRVQDDTIIVLYRDGRAQHAIHYPDPFYVVKNLKFGSLSDVVVFQARIHKEVTANRTNIIMTYCDN